MTKNNMFHFKHQDGGITFIGWNEEKEVYSTSYYANVGLLNANESKYVQLKEVRRLTQWCKNQGYKEVAYLPRD